MKRPILLIACLLFAATPLMAEDTAEEVAPLWTGSAGLSYLATSGNTDTETFGLSFKLNREPQPWGWDLKANFLRADQDGETTAEQYTAGARAVRSVNDRGELFGGLSAEQNEFAGFDLRGVVEAGATYNALLGPVHDLSFDAGLTWTTEDFVDGTDDNYIGAILGLAYEWKISETASFTQGLVWYPNLDESSNWRATSETALQAALNSKLSLKVGYLVKYYNEPLESFDDTDTTTTLSLVVSF